MNLYCSSFFLIAVKIDITALIFHHMLDNGKPQAGSSRLFGMALIDPVEALKNPLLVLHGYTDTGIGDADQRPALLLQNLHQNRSVHHIIFDGVLTEIIDHVVHQLPDSQQVYPVSFQAHSHLLLLGHRLQAAYHLLRHGIQVHLLPALMHIPLVQAADLYDVVDQCQEPGRLLINFTCKGGNILRGHQAVLHQLRVAGNGGQGRLQLVGYIGGELLSQALCLLLLRDI